MGRVQGKVALITGAARGQGRAHALRLAEEGADIIAVDLCDQVDTVPYPMATPADLQQTVKQVEALDRRVLAVKADVRDLPALRNVVDRGVDQLGHIDVVCANAGIANGFASGWELDEAMVQDVIDIDLVGLWKTTTAAVPAMIDARRGGSIILTSSVAGLIAFPNLTHYNAAKHGVVGLMKSLAIELAPHRIRANSVHPGTVDTPMVMNPAGFRLFMGDPNATREQAAVAMQPMNALPVPWVEDRDISNAVLFLASDEARYVTGQALAVDAGTMQPFKLPHRPDADSE